MACFQVHELVLKSIMNSPMSFFDVTPSGRILNRFSKDMDESEFFLILTNLSWSHHFAVDTRIPFLVEAVAQYFLICISQVAATVDKYDYLCQRSSLSVSFSLTSLLDLPSSLSPLYCLTLPWTPAFWRQRSWTTSWSRPWSTISPHPWRASLSSVVSGRRKFSKSVSTATSTSPWQPTLSSDWHSAGSCGGWIAWAWSRSPSPPSSSLPPRVRSLLPLQALPLPASFRYISSSTIHRTGSRLMSWFQSRKWVKVKVVKLCFKKWNGHILMHIYHIQCEFIQKNQWKGSNGQIHRFCKGNQLRGAKNMEN